MKDSETGDWKSKETFWHYQEAEIKHGRVAMVAILGFLATSVWRFPEFEGVPDGWAALQTSQGGAGFGIIFILAAGLELQAGKQNPSREPGDLGDPAGLLKLRTGPEGDVIWKYTTEMRNMEINHGRLAMSGFLTEGLAEYGRRLKGGPDFGPAEQLQWMSENLPMITAVVLAVLIVTSPEDYGTPPETVKEMREVTPSEDKAAAA